MIKWKVRERGRQILREKETDIERERTKKQREQE